MTTIIQNILVVVALIIAVVFLIGKFIYSPQKKTSKNCDSNDCGCH
ncbi:FeoB-associated Cys-rich membrane protein [Hanstruepera neustonica]|uniref:FeoB-associated Cys-rich membrane protein n=1 Tax=Hanstruepera neustonica TaxID=1445657 RepID=A0A2K1E349_9FLAO|nr:FeoB-associated Cys-rich membrane protein [Hanstruepera neustonica]PNQ74687.1 FeoB-associated Cys-rich membrane protein [Hanstruepera neustonica]